jgi:hypothetical protein
MIARFGEVIRRRNGDSRCNAIRIFFAQTSQQTEQDIATK